MVGKRSSKDSSPVASSQRWSTPCSSMRRVMARDTSSRGSSSSTNRSPLASRSSAPWPRSASDSSGRGICGMVQRGRVELDELDVGHRRAGPQGHGDAVAGALDRVGGDGEQLPGAARGEQHVGGPHDLHRALAVPGADPGAATVLDDQVEGERVLVQRGGGAPHRLDEGPLDLHPGGRPAGMHDPRPGCGRPRGPARARPCSSRSNMAPRAMSSLTRPGPSSTSTRTASESQRPAPAASVSARCRSVESGSAASTAATPPCAQRVVAWCSSPLVSTPTRRPCMSAARTAADSPATPLPSTSRSSGAGSPGSHADRPGR